MGGGRGRLITSGERKEAMFKSMGMAVSRASLSNWVIKAADLLKPLVDLLHQHIKQYDIAYADETTLQVIKQAKEKCYMWLFIGGPPEKQAWLLSNARGPL